MRGAKSNEHHQFHYEKYRDNGTEFKICITKNLEKYNVDVCRVTTKCKHKLTLVEACNKEFVKILVEPMDTQELQDSEKVLDIWVEKLKNIVHKMNNTK